MRTLVIAGKEYTVEYSIEASLYSDCTEKVTGLMAGLASASGSDDMHKLISSMADVPQTTLHMFHAGLLEHHDGITYAESKKLIATFLKENKDGEYGNFYGLMGMLIEEMTNDGFFELIGLDKMFAPTTKKAKTPSDHKKKQ